MSCLIFSFSRSNSTTCRLIFSQSYFRCLFQQARSMLSQEPFQGQTDRFNGITISTIKYLMKPEDFSIKLEESLAKWLKEGKRCVWFKVNIQQSVLVPVLAKKGFNFHHARDDFVMMYKWLLKSKPNLPPASYTNLAVGAMVFNNTDQILAVSEHHYDYPHWKFPGGYVEPGEDITDAAVREVKEETGVDASFQTLVTFMHAHNNSVFGNSDIYSMLMMKAVKDEIKISSREIKECKWMDVKEFINHPHVHPFYKPLVASALQLKERNIKIDLHKTTVQMSKVDRKVSYLTIEKSDYH